MHEMREGSEREDKGSFFLPFPRASCRRDSPSPCTFLAPCRLVMKLIIELTENPEGLEGGKEDDGSFGHGMPPSLPNTDPISVLNL